MNVWLAAMMAQDGTYVRSMKLHNSSKPLASRFRMARSLALLLGLFSLCKLSLCAQVSFDSAIAGAVRNSPRLKMAQDDVNKATAAVSETKDIYIPSIGLGGGLGRSYGITLTVPTIFTVNAQSLIYSAPQRSYIRAAKQSLQAARLTLEDVRQQVEEDAALTYISLEQARQRKIVLIEEVSMAERLVDITQHRMDSGLESDLELKKSRRVLAQFRLQQPRLENEIAALREHLSQLTGIASSDTITIAGTIPPRIKTIDVSDRNDSLPDNPAIRSSQATAESKAQQARGDRKFAFRPQIAMQSQYGRISPINNVSDYYNLNGRYNTMQFGIAIQLPLFDKTHAARARETAADAMHAQHEAQYVRSQQIEAHMKLLNSLTELSARLDLAELDRDISHDQLNAMLLEVKTRSADVTGGRQMNPKDEVFARLDERQKYLEWLDADVDLRKTQIMVMRQNGELDAWLSSLRTP